jgi:hypothetical protein
MSESCTRTTARSSARTTDWQVIAASSFSSREA